MHILQMSMQAGVLIIAVVLVRTVAFNKLPKSIFLLLWGIALIRLLMPFSLSCRISIYTLVNKVLHSGVVCQTQVPGMSPLPNGYGNGQAGGSAAAMRILDHDAISMRILLPVWIIGTLILFLFFAAGYRRNCRELASAQMIGENRIIDRWLNRHKLLRPLAVLHSDRLATPIAVGCIRPRIILPTAMDMSDEKLLHYVLEHEYCHIRRFDAVWKLVAIFAACVHWFNPLVWIMLVLMNRDLEIACDEMVLRHFGAETKVAYADCLIHLAEQRRTLTPFYSGFSRNATEERIVSIMKYQKTSFAAALMSLICIVTIFSVFATSAAAADPSIVSARAAELESDDQLYTQAISDWEQFGVTFSQSDARVYFNGQLIRFFVDNRSTDPDSFSGTVYDCDDGTDYFVTRRDASGTLIGIDRITEADADSIAHWK